MGTTAIDTIQNEQIVALEADVALLTSTLNTLVTDINQVTPKLNTAITNLNNLASCIRNNYSPSGTTSGDGLLKRLTQFDDDFTTHISRKMPPVVDLKGQPHIGFHVNNTPVKHAHPEGWTATTGTCLTATVTANTWTGGNVTNVWFVPKSTSNWYPPTNQTWAGLISWYALPRAAIYATNGVVSSADFQLREYWGEEQTMQTVRLDMDGLLVMR